MPVRLFVGNLPYNATEGELRELFSEVGSALSIYLPTDRESGKPRGFAFVEFSDRAHAEEIIRRFNNHLFKGRPLAISEARAKDDRPQTPRPPRPPTPRPPSVPDPYISDPPAGGEKPSRNFGPDATPRRKTSKAKSVSKSERAPKGPMREVSRGRFFGGDEDDDFSDDFLDDDLDGENFASRESDLESDE